MPSTPVSVLSQVSPRTGLLISIRVCVCRIRILQAATASVAAAAWAHKWHLAGKHSVRHHPHPHHHHGHPPAAIQPQHLHLHRCQAHCWRANAHRCYYNSFLCWCHLSTHNYFTLHNEPRIQVSWVRDSLVPGWLFYMPHLERFEFIKWVFFCITLPAGMQFV